MIPIPIASGLISAGGGLLSSLFGMGSQAQANKANLRAVRETNAANRELARYSYEQNLAQWNRENEYNKPVNVMARYRDAGLNPNLIYGNGTSAHAASSPQMKVPDQIAPHVDPLPSPQNLGDAFLNGMGQATAMEYRQDQRKLVASQIEFNKANALNKLAEYSGTVANSNLKKLEYQIQNDLKDITVEKGRMGLELINVQIEGRRAETNRLNTLLNYEVENFRARNDLTDAQTRKVAYELQYVAAKTAEAIANTQLTNYNASIASSNAQYLINIAGGRTARFVQECNNLIKDGQLKDKTLEEKIQTIQRLYQETVGKYIENQKAAQTVSWDIAKKIAETVSASADAIWDIVLPL